MIQNFIMAKGAINISYHDWQSWWLLNHPHVPRCRDGSFGRTTVDVQA